MLLQKTVYITGADRGDFFYLSAGF